jgi:hypothetical protein
MSEVASGQGVSKGLDLSKLGLSKLGSVLGSTKGITERVGLGVGGVFTFLYGILEIFILAILVTIVYSNLPKIGGFDSNPSLQTNREAFFGYMVFLWIVVAINTIFILPSLPFGFAWLTIPYVSFIFIGINFIITMILLIYAIITLVNVGKTSDYQSGAPNAKYVYNILVAIIVLTIISLLLLLSFGIYSVVKYRPKQDLEIVGDVVPEVGAVVTAGELLTVVTKS